MTRPSTFIALAMMSTGGLAALRTLARHQTRRAADKQVHIVVDYDDVQAVSIRAGMPLGELLPKLKESGATHCTLPELTINRLLQTGQLFQSAPLEPFSQPAPFGRWVYLASAADVLLEQVITELQARLPHVEAQMVRAVQSTRNIFTFAGDLPTVGEIGLGFDCNAAAEIHRAALLVVPRPVSYDWHERALIERTLSQAAAVGDGVVAFEGNLILGHEMHLNETLSALDANKLTFAYFAESRHQRGDWFIAKRRMPHVISAHQFTAAQMIPEDYHSLAHHWANLARERGVRMLFVNFFRVVHATEPLECLKYLEHIRGAVTGAGFIVGGQGTEDRDQNPQLPAPDSRPLIGLVPVGAGALAARNLLGLNDAATIALAGTGAMATVAVVNQLDRARNELEQQYAPTYSSKLLALGTAALTPLAAILAAQKTDDALEAILIDSLASFASAAALAALTSSDEYRLRVEEYKGFDLDVWLPLVAALASNVKPLKRSNIFTLLAVTFIGWYGTRRFAPDPFARFDASPAMSHTHHLSSAMRMVGDTLLALGPRPIRKWAGLAPFGLALSMAARQRGLKSLSLAGITLSVIGHVAANTGFRRPERDPRATADATMKSWLVGSVAGLLIASAIKNLKSQI